MSNSNPKPTGKVCWCGRPSEPPKWKLCGYVCERCDKLEKTQHAHERAERKDSGIPQYYNGDDRNCLVCDMVFIQKAHNQLVCSSKCNKIRSSQLHAARKKSKINLFGYRFSGI